MHTIFKNNASDEKAPDPATDIPLFRSPRNNAADSTPVKRGTDLIAIKDPNGTIRFCIKEWSEIPGENDRTLTVSEEFAIFFIQDICCHKEYCDGLDHDTLMEYLPKLYWWRERTVHPV